jgi:hypothetical protein
VVCCTRESFACLVFILRADHSTGRGIPIPCPEFSNYCQLLIGGPAAWRLAHATGGACDDDEYRHLREELLRIPQLKDKLPTFLRTCRDTAAFWSFIKTRFGTYEERRQYLRSEFESALAALEAEAFDPAEENVVEALAKLDSQHVADAWRKARDRRIHDPEGAITAAQTLVESVCKHILDERAVVYAEKDDLPKLYGLAAAELNLSPSQHTEQVFKQILGGCKSVLEGLGALRNKLSDAHGKGKRAIKPSIRHAELAVNLAGIMATFIVSTWEARNTTKQ